MKDVKVISYIIPGKGRSENFKGTGGSTTIINNTTTSGGGNSGASTDSVKYAEEARTAKYAEEAGKAAIAERAKAADAATEAAHAQTADVAETAGEATKAKHADVAVNAQRADSADHANLANEAVHAQTADRVGEADHAKTADLATLAKNLTADSTDWQKIDGKIEESEKRAEKKFISKLHDDVAKGKIRFEDFITLVRGMWLGDAKIVRAIQSGAAVEADDTAIMTVAKMIGTFLRKDTEDETRYLLKLLGGAIFAYLKTPDWTAGGMLGTGIGAYQDASGMWVIETDKLLVRVKAIFEELEIRRLSYVGGNLLLSGAGSVITAVEDKGTFWRCTIKNDDGTTATMNYWRAGDQARCQTFNIKAGVYQNVQNRYWWRLVTEVGEDYIDVSKSDCEASSDAPAAGDHVVQLGNRTDTERQHAIMLSAVGTDAPAITQYQGINSYRLTGRQKTRISPHGNVFTGDFYLNDGRSLLQVIDGKITSVISETVRTATDKDNYLTNGSFATGLDGWQGASSTRYFKVGAKYVWANKSPLANKLGAGCSWTTDSGHPVARIAASQLVQLQADYAKRPEIKLLNNKKQAVPVYLSLYVKVLEAGTLTISIASEVTTNFDTFTPLSYSEALTADGEYLHVEATGYWSGTGNLTIATDGVMLIHDVMFTLNEYTYYESRIEQTAQHILLEVQRVENKADSNTTRIGALEVTAESITARVSAVETTASSNSSSISTLQQTVSGISATVSSHTSQISQMGNDLGTANGNIVSVTSRVADLELSASGFSTSISALQTTTGTHTSQISGLQQTANGISTRVTNIENDYATGTALTQTSNSITARVNNVLENQGGRNLLTSSLINETSTLYGFAKRYVRLTAGQKYTLSANGIVPYNAYANDMVLRVYIFRYADQSDVNNGLASNVGDWCNNSNSFAISYNSGNSQTKYVTFTADKTATFVIESYMYHNTGAAYGGTRSYGVTTNWYKLEKGDTATAWQAGIDDQVIWKNYITNPLATDATIGQDVTSHSIITDDRFGRVRKIEASANGNWQMTFTAGNNYDELVGKVATFFIICKRYGGNYSAVEAKTEQLVFGGGDENVNVIHTNNCEFRDLGDGWRLYYSSRQIKTGLMSNTQGIDSGVIGVNTLKGVWLIYAAGVVQGGVCPAVADIMEACGLLATGIDITNKKVVITADNFTVQTNSGQKALVAADGKVNIQLLDAVQIVANGIKAQTIDVENANFQNMTISGKSVFKGSVQNPFSVIDSYSVDYNDNVVVLSSGSGGWNGSYSYSLPWTIAQSGRLIRMVNYRWGSSYATGYATLSAPSGKYFFEDGAKKSSIKISREVIELLGYGTASEFYGWIVIKRIDIDTVHKYGRHPRVLAMGRVSGSSMSYKSFDGSTLTATNLGTGLYKVSIPSAWNVEAGELIVMATALYDIGNSTNDNPCYAGVHNIEAENGVVTSFTLQCGDDDSRNDGTIQFMVFNKMDWYYM